MGLRAAVGAGVEFGVEAIGRERPSSLPVPDTLLAQARLAARASVGLDTVLRRYLAGHALLGDFVLEEAERTSHDPAELKRLLRRLAEAADSLLGAVSVAYGAEAERFRRDSPRRRAELIERLLGGEPLDAAELGYELGAHHLALIASGPGAEALLKELARSLDARPLALPREGDVLWAWLGRRRPFDPREALRLAEAARPPAAAISLGEPGEARAGWSLSHRQARAAWPIALRGPRAAVRYADVALLATVLHDEVLAASLRKLYLEPLEAERDGGETLRETLRAYFAADCSVSSAAVALRVKRHTVTSRLRTVESLIGHPPNSRTAELETALGLAELESLPAPLALR